MWDLIYAEAVLKAMSLKGNEQPGWFEFRHYVDINGVRHSGLDFNCPCGCHDPGWIPLVANKAAHNDHTWEWDGREDIPTLSPSIRRNNGCRFHGYLKAGVWSTAGDGAPLDANVYSGAAGHMPPSKTTYAERTSMESTPQTPPPAQQESTSGTANAGSPTLPTEHPVQESAPSGFSASGVLKFLNGKLHQLFSTHDSSAPTPHVWVPVPGTSIPGGIMSAVEQYVEEKFKTLPTGIQDRKSVV